MTEVCYAKFSQNADLAKRLLETDNLYLEETNDWEDRFWGRDQFGNGINMLGNVLMFVRSTLKK